MTVTTVRPKIDRGVKRRCAACDTLFYDLLHYPIQCPKCGAAVDARAGSAASAAKRFKAATKRTSAKNKKAAPVAKEKPRKEKSEDSEVDDRSDQDDLILDRDDDDE